MLHMRHVSQEMTGYMVKLCRRKNKTTRKIEVEVRGAYAC